MAVRIADHLVGQLPTICEFQNLHVFSPAWRVTATVEPPFG